MKKGDGVIVKNPESCWYDRVGKVLSFPFHAANGREVIWVSIEWSDVELPQMFKPSELELIED